MPENEISEKLSKREQQVLELIVTGASNKEIAHKLVISVNTVKVHVRNVFEKLEVQSRTEATVLAIQEGLVSVDSDDANSADEPETSSPVTRTFLLNNNPPLVLSRWREIYLLVALGLALAVAIIPLLQRTNRQAAPKLPVIYVQDQAPTPVPQTNGTSSDWTTQSPMSNSRAGLALVAAGNQLFAIGGVRDNNQATRSVEIFNATDKSWSEGASKPTAATNVSGVLIDDQIFLPGGCTNQGEAIDTLEIYTPETDSWRSGSPLPSPRCAYGLTTLNDNLYLFGGWNGENFEDTIFVYSPADDSWELLPETLPIPIGFMGAATLSDTIYIVGGYDGEQEYNQTYAFNPTQKVWQEKAPMQESRGGLGLVATTNNLYAIGGGWEHELSNSEKYDPASDSWSTFETPFAGQWRNLGLTLIDTNIYAAGGWDGTNEEFMDSLVSHQFLYQLFLPISNFGNQPDEQE